MSSSLSMIPSSIRGWKPHHLMTRNAASVLWHTCWRPRRPSQPSQLQHPVRRHCRRSQPQRHPWLPTRQSGPSLTAILPSLRLLVARVPPLNMSWTYTSQLQQLPATSVHFVGGRLTWRHTRWSLKSPAVCRQFRRHRWPVRGYFLRQVTSSPRSAIALHQQRLIASFSEWKIFIRPSVTVLVTLVDECAMTWHHNF